MTRQKSFKVRVRARMSKTGESYTTARRHLLNRREPAPAIAPATDVAMLSKLSDAALHQRTGRGWDAWFARLDAWGATNRTHAEVARWLVAEQQVDNWSAQSITVGYEQARGLRAPGQQANGDFVANATRTVAMPMDRLFDAFVDASLRDRWLPGSTPRVRTATAPKSLRADWADGSSRIAVWFTPKGLAKTQVAVAHEKLADAAAVAAMKAYWRERLTTLKQLLES
jgi:hypothetical protein